MAKRQEKWRPALKAAAILFSFLKCWPRATGSIPSGKNRKQSLNNNNNSNNSKKNNNNKLIINKLCQKVNHQIIKNHRFISPHSSQGFGWSCDLPLDQSRHTGGGATLMWKSRWGKGGLLGNSSLSPEKWFFFLGFFCIIQINGERNSTRNAITKVIRNRVIHQHWHTALYANEHAQTPIFSCTITRASDKFNWELTSICCRVNILRIWTTFLVIWRRRVSTHVAFRRRLGPD